MKRKFNTWRPIAVFLFNFMFFCSTYWEEYILRRIGKEKQSIFGFWRVKLRYQFFACLLQLPPPTIPSSILESTTRFVIYVKFNIRYSYEIKRGSSNPTSQNKKTQAIEMEIACALTDWSIKSSKGWCFPPNCNAISGKGFTLDEIYIERY